MMTEVVWSSNDGLRQRDAALFVTPGVLLEADNLMWLNEGAMQMRLGSASESLTSAGFTGEVQWMTSFFPVDDGPEELWAAANNSGTVAWARRVSGTWSTVTVSDTATAASLRYTHAAALNGKLFVAYDSAENRLHVWDGTDFRRVGLSKPTAPLVADNGAGAYAATARRYRISFRIKDGDDIVTESELSSATSFTPSGTGTSARITKPTTVDSATHWVVWGLIGSSGDTYDLYEELTELAVGTTFYDDTTAPSAYDGDFPPELGLNVPPPSVKYIVSTGVRLVMAGAWETSGATDQTTPKSNRVWYTRVLGTSDRGDDESIPNTATVSNYIDVGDASAITGLAGPLFGEIYVFKQRHVYKLVPTGDSTAPFAVVLVSDSYGAVDQRVIAMGANPQGGPAIFFGDEHVVFTITDGGLSPASTQIARDLRASPLTAEDSLLAYDPFSQTVLVQVASSPSTVAGSYKAFTFDTLKARWSGFSLGGATGGWTLGASALGTDTTLAGGGAAIRCAAVATISDTGTRRLLLGGQDAEAASSIRNLGGQCVMDGATAFTSRARIRQVAQPGYKFSAGNPTIFYRNPQGATSGTLTCAIAYLRPSGPSGESVTVSASTTLTATTDESGIELQEYTFEGVTWADISVLDVRLTLSYSGTAFQSAVPPTIDAVVIPVRVQEPLAR